MYELAKAEIYCICLCWLGISVYCRFVLAWGNFCSLGMFVFAEDELYTN